MKEHRVLVKSYFDQGKSAPEIFSLVKGIGIKQRFVQYWVKRLRENGGIEDAKRCGRTRTVRTKSMVKTVRDRIRRNPERRSRELAVKLNTSKSSMHRLLRRDLRLKCYKKRKAHGLSDAQKENRVIRSKNLIKRFKLARWKKLENLIFSDEKLFEVRQTHNSKNDVVYALKIEDIPEKSRTVQRFQKSSSVMVWGAVSKTAKLPLVFVEKGVKINANFYLTEILEAELKVQADLTHGEGNWCFQQDSAPAHKAKVTQDWCKDQCPDFISADEWPASSPDLNPLDYSIWGVMEAKVNAKVHRSLDSLKRTLIKEWEKLSMNYVRASIDAWPKRLQAVVDADGGRIE